MKIEAISQNPAMAARTKKGRLADRLFGGRHRDGEAISWR